MLTDNTLAVLSRLLFGAGAALPFLRAPIEQMERIPDDGVDGLATDGLSLFYGPKAAPDATAVAHLLMHCLFRHPVVPEGVVPKELASRRMPLWDLACDVSAEYLRGEFFPSGEANRVRREIAEVLPEDVDPRVAGAVYRALMDRFEDDLALLHARFRRDDHRYWYAPPCRGDFQSPAGYGFASPTNVPRDGWIDPNDGAKAARGESGKSGARPSTYAQWRAEAMAQRWPSPDALPGGTVRTGRHGLAPGSREERMVLRAEAKYDFSRYLRRFATTREELRLDLDSFDAIAYYYGMHRYGNLPLIEPLEYTESFKVESLVIAIDTSGSCTRPIVQRFLGEIERMLLCHDGFFSDMEIHIVQCDAIVQSHDVIRSVEAWKKYAKDLVIRGRGGTNFTPVFDLVEKLRRGGALKRLKGLIYFTDGDGVYPRKPTPYETAFVFATRKALSYSLPKWIVPLCLEREAQDANVTGRVSVQTGKY